jgi:hypothetical protein
VIFGLRASAAKTTDAKAARRMPAIALVMEGKDRRTAAESCGMDRQTLRDRVHRYNAVGLAGLSNRRSAGPRPRLSSEQKAELAQMVREGPDPVVDGVVRLAARGPEGQDRGALRRDDAPAHSGQAAGRTRVSPPLGAPAAPEPIPKHRRRSKELRRDGRRGPAGARPRQTAGGVVSG